MSENDIQQQQPIIAFGVNNIGCDQRGATFQTIVPSPGSATAKVTKPIYPFITIPSLTDSIISKLLSYLQGKEISQPKDIMKPIRAAQDAGVIRRITPAKPTSNTSPLCGQYKKLCISESRLLSRRRFQLNCVKTLKQ